MEKIGDLLVRTSACTPEAVQLALESQVILGGRLGTNLLDLGLVSERDLAFALRLRHGVPSAHGDLLIPLEVLAEVPRELASRYGVVPFSLDRRGLLLLTCDPSDLKALDAVSFALGMSTRPVVVPEARMWALLKRHYRIDHALRGITLDSSELGPVRDPEPPPSALPGRAPRELPAELIDDAEFEVLYASRLGAPPQQPSRRRSCPDPSEHLSKGAAGDALRTLLGHAGERFGRALLLAILPGHPATAAGWLGQGIDAKLVERVSLPLLGESIVDQAVSTRAPVLGPLPWCQANRHLVEAIGGGGPRNALVVPVVAFGRALAVLYADNGPQRAIRGSVVDVLELAAKASRIIEQRLKRSPYDAGTPPVGSRDP
jgi:hypothetical protein